MPLYFFLSGLFFKTYGGFFDLALRKFNKIIVPAFSFVIFGFLFFLIVAPALGHITVEGAVSLIVETIKGGRTFNHPMWFLVSLFWTNLIFCLLRISVRNGILLAVMVCALGFFGYYAHLHDFANPCWIVSSLSALPYFYLGYAANRTPLLYPGKYDRFSLPAGILLTLVALVLSVSSGNPHIDFANNEFTANAAICYLAGILVVSGILLICKKIRRLPFISYIGRYSIMILGLHVPMLLPVRLLGNGHISPEAVSWLAFIFSIGVSAACIPLLKRYLPEFTAQKDLIHPHPFSLRHILRTKA